MNTLTKPKLSRSGESAVTMLKVKKTFWQLMIWERVYSLLLKVGGLEIKIKVRRLA